MKYKSEMNDKWIGLLTRADVDENEQSVSKCV